MFRLDLSTCSNCVFEAILLFFAWLKTGRTLRLRLRISSASRLLLGAQTTPGISMKQQLRVFLMSAL